MNSHNEITYVYLLHLETNMDEHPDRIFRTKEDAITAAWLYMDSGLNNVSDQTNRLRHSEDIVLMLYGERPWRDTYLDTIVVVRQVQLE
jgi:hypothetical protein